MGETTHQRREAGSLDPSKHQHVLRIGELLIKEGFAKKQDIERALEIQRREKELSDYPLGQILVKMGTLSQSQLDELLNHPNLTRNIGSYIVEKRFLMRSFLVLDNLIALFTPSLFWGES